MTGTDTDIDMSGWTDCRYHCPELYHWTEQIHRKSTKA